MKILVPWKLFHGLFTYYLWFIGTYILMYALSISECFPEAEPCSAQVSEL